MKCVQLINLVIPQLHNAANANQKEKYEADLKKEIKKLQVRMCFYLISLSLSTCQCNISMTLVNYALLSR